jgi:hypothetical protein
MTRDPQRLGEIAANAVLIVVVGILGALALVHFFTPCVEGALC